MDSKTHVNPSIGKPNRELYRMTKFVSNFSGRSDDTIWLRKSVENKNGLNVTWIHGLPSVGKSTIVKAFATDYFKGDVYWINSETFVQFSQNLVDLAHSLGIQADSDADSTKSVTEILELITGIYQKLSENVGEHGLPHLIAFDNFSTETGGDDDSFEIENFFPSETLENIIHLIITSTEIPLRENINKRKIGPLKLEESISLLKLSLPEDTYDRKSLKELAIRLGNLPLQLQLAIEYIREMNDKGVKFIIRHYLEFYAENPSQVLNSSLTSGKDEEWCYEKSSYSAWMAVVKKIHGMENGDNTILLLNILSYLNPDEIPMELFDLNIFSESLEILVKFNLVDRNELQNGYKYTMHPLVQRVIRIHLQRDDEKVARDLLQITLTDIFKNHIKSLLQESILGDFGDGYRYIYPWSFPVYLDQLDEAKHGFLCEKIDMKCFKPKNIAYGYDQEGEGGELIHFPVLDNYAYYCFEVKFEFKPDEKYFALIGTYKMYQII